MLRLATLQYGLAPLVMSSECKCLEDLESSSKSFGCKCDTTCTTISSSAGTNKPEAEESAGDKPAVEHGRNKYLVEDIQWRDHYQR